MASTRTPWRTLAPRASACLQQAGDRSASARPGTRVCGVPFRPSRNTNVAVAPVRSSMNSAPSLRRKSLVVQHHAQPLEDRQVDRQQRLADVEAREDFLLEQQHVVAVVRQQVGRGRARGPAADDQDVAGRLSSRRRGRHTRRNSSEVLMPPNAKLLFIMMFMFGCVDAFHFADSAAARSGDRACRGSSSAPGSRSFIIARQNADSSAPQAPSVWPGVSLGRADRDACRRTPAASPGSR